MCGLVCSVVCLCISCVALTIGWALSSCQLKKELDLVQDSWHSICSSRAQDQFFHRIELAKKDDTIKMLVNTVRILRRKA